MPKKDTAAEPNSQEFELQMLRLKSIFGLDIKLVQDDRDDHESSKFMKKDDPRRNEIKLKLNSFSIPFAITKKMIGELKKFFKEQGWEFVALTSTPSIKIRKIQEVA